MNTPRPYQKIALFLLGLVVVFGAAAALGSAFEPAATEEDGMEKTMDAHAMEKTAHEPAGLGVSAGSYSLRMSPSRLQRGQARELRFTIEADGAPVTEFDELHERRMHLIVVRRDGAEFQHLHPEMDAAGTWTVPVEFDAAGVYRAFADFSVEGEQQTLATDLFVSGGRFEARPFPAPQPLAETDGYEVRLAAADPVAGESAELDFTVSRAGRPVEDLAPYLGAKGHLVALREGDLAFLHVHPEEGHEVPAEIEFAATFPTPGRYRLYLQFKHDGTVHTAEFTVVAR
jgi:plastocyanin